MRYPSLSGQVVFVTGGDSGIGAACAALLRNEGAEVVISTLPDRSSGESAIALDLRSPTSIAAAIDAVVERYGRLDILINNAGVGTATVAAFADGAAEQDSAMLTINADGALKMCQAYIARLPQMPVGPKKIINLSSVGGGITQFNGFRLSDGMSKAAIAHLTRQLAAEHVDTDLDVFAICPGATDTPMFRASTLDSMTADERASFASGLPKGRLIDPREIAEVVCFLASAHSRVLHGAVIDASMGLGVRPGVLTEHTH